MAKSLIRKNQLHPDISDLVSGYGSLFFPSLDDFNSLSGEFYNLSGGVYNFSGNLNQNFYTLSGNLNQNFHTLSGNLNQDVYTLSRNLNTLSGNLYQDVYTLSGYILNFSGGSGTIIQITGGLDLESYFPVYRTGDQEIFDHKKFEKITNLSNAPFLFSGEGKYIEKINSIVLDSGNLHYISPEYRNSLVFIHIKDINKYVIHLPRFQQSFNADCIKYVIKSLPFYEINDTGTFWYMSGCSSDGSPECSGCSGSFGTGINGIDCAECLSDCLPEISGFAPYTNINKNINISGLRIEFLGDYKHVPGEITYNSITPAILETGILAIFEPRHVGDSISFIYQDESWHIETSQIYEPDEYIPSHEHSIYDIVDFDSSGIVYTSKNQTIGGEKIFEAENYIFEAENYIFEASGYVFSGAKFIFSDDAKVNFEGDILVRNKIDGGTIGYSTINMNQGYLGKNLVLSPDTPQSLNWLNKELSGQWKTNERLLVNGTGVLLQGESAANNGENYVTVETSNNPVTNGNNLLQAYATAKTQTPNGKVLSPTNRIAIILPPAKYELGTESLTLDTEYIDLIGSTTDRDRHHITSNVGTINKGTIIQTANDVKLINLKIENTNNTYSAGFISSDPAAYFPNTGLNNTYIKNVIFLTNDVNAWSTRLDIIYNGTFIDCTGGDGSFGGYGTASGIFTNCTGGHSSFGGNGTASGTFTNCTGGHSSFGGNGGTASGAFVGCTGEKNSFGGGNGTASGTFTNCTGGKNSFNL